MGDIIDLRSDTVTKPTAEMRESMKNAVVGDDILRDDPTVLELEDLAAGIFGKEAAIFTISGTMSNEIAVMVYTKPGEEIIVHQDSHIYNLETGALAALSGVQARVVESVNGIFNSGALEKSILQKGVQLADKSLICLENTFHLNRGLAIRNEDLKETIEIAKTNNIPLYMDGARLFNAAVALNTEPANLVESCDSVAVCLSKGLCAPLGSILAGRKDFIEEARRVKQRFGGGMRQAGVIAAPAIIGLTEMVTRLPEDHKNAEIMRQALEKLGFKVDREGILTNIINVDVSPAGWDAALLAQKLEAFNIKIKICTENTNRMVLHNDITCEHINFVLEKIKKIVG
jgi:threonine aldolase